MVAPLVKCLLYKHEEPGSDPQHPCKKVGTAAFIGHTELEKWNRKIPGASWSQSSQISVSQAQ